MRFSLTAATIGRNRILKFCFILKESEDNDSDEDREIEERRIREKERRREEHERYRGKAERRQAREPRIDPMDPASYSDAPRGSWSSGLEKANDN